MMTKQDLEIALALAKANKTESCDIFFGFALPDFSPVVATIGQLAGLVSWQCACFDGSIDSAALTEIWRFRSRFTILGGALETCCILAEVREEVSLATKRNRQ